MKIIVLSKKLAKQYSKSVTKKCIIVSITNSDDEDVVFEKNDAILSVFRMKFDDIDSEELGLKVPSEDNFTGLKLWIDTYLNEIDEIMVHCLAGQSRSAGVAAGICEYLGEIDIFHNNTKYTPNTKAFISTKKELGLYKDEQYYNHLFT